MHLELLTKSKNETSKVIISLPIINLKLVLTAFETCSTSSFGYNLLYTGEIGSLCSFFIFHIRSEILRTQIKLTIAEVSRNHLGDIVIKVVRMLY